MMAKIKPAIAKPFCAFFLQRPTIEKIKPRINKIKFKIGTQHKINPISDKTKPAVPAELLLLSAIGKFSSIVITPDTCRAQLLGRFVN